MEQVTEKKYVGKAKVEVLLSLDDITFAAAAGWCREQFGRYGDQWNTYCVESKWRFVSKKDATWFLLTWAGKQCK